MNNQMKEEQDQLSVEPELRPKFNSLRRKMDQEVNDFVNAFKLKFKLKFGTTPYVSFNCRGNYQGELSLHELIGIVDRAYSDSEKKKVKGVLQKRRFKGLIVYRHVLCKIAADLGYTYSEIGRRTKMNRVSVLHATTSINSKLAVNDPLTVNCLEEVYTRIELFLSNREEKDKPWIKN